jgi:hypothetical protein
MGPGPYLARTVAALVKKNESAAKRTYLLICPFCAEEMADPDSEILWVVTEQDYATHPITQAWVRQRARELVRGEA